MFTFIKIWWYARILRSSPETNARVAAAKALAQLGRRAVQPLIEALDGSDWFEVRTAAAESLGRLGHARAVEPLLRALDRSQHFFVREAAANSLGQLADPRAFEPLIEALRGKDAEVRRAAARALGHLRDQRAVKPLIQALGDGQPNCRRNAADSLEQLGYPKWAQWVTGNEIDFYRLGASKDREALEPLISALEYRDRNDYQSPMTRHAAAESLGNLGDLRAVDPLLRALGDYGSVALAAAKSLAQLGDPRGVNRLVQALGDRRDASVREKGARALGELREPRAFKPLIQALGDGEGDVRKTAAYALARLGHPQWAEWVKGELSDFQRLGLSQDAEAVKVLMCALGAHTPKGAADVRRAAASALVNISVENPNVLRGDWQQAAQLVGQPHTDSHKDWAGSCAEPPVNTHADHGIGLDFPDPPPSFKQARTSDADQHTQKRIVLHCRSCGKRIHAPIHLAGRAGRCPSCGAVIQLPAQPDDGTDVTSDF